MAEVSIKLDHGALQRMLLSPNGDVGRHTQRLGHEVVREAKSRAPIAHQGKHIGELRKSISITEWPGPRGSLQITANTKFALAVHEGSKPHKISGKNGGMLRFPGRSGKLVVIRSVNHPGHAKGNPFLMDALRAVVMRNR